MRLYSRSFIVLEYIKSLLNLSSLFMPGCFTHVVSTFVLHFPSIANVDGQIFIYIFI